MWLLALIPPGYLAAGIVATFVLWPRGHESPPGDDDLTMLLRMVGLWPVYAAIELAGLGAEALAVTLRWRMRQKQWFWRKR